MDIFIIFTFMYATIPQRIYCPKFDISLKNKYKNHGKYGHYQS